VEGVLATCGAYAAYPVFEFDTKLREYAIDRPALVSRPPRASKIPVQFFTSCACAARRMS